MKLNNVIIYLVLCIGFVACSKKPDPEPKPVEASRADKTRDSIYLYAKEVYLWNDAIPTYDVFKPRRFTYAATDLLNFEQELIALAQYKINSTTGLPYEYYSNGTDSKYSYIVDKADENPVAFAGSERSVVDLEGNGDDLGFRWGAYGNSASNANSFDLMMTAIYQNSPADKAGMKRSDKVLKINGVAVGANFNVDRDLINESIGKNSILLEYVKYVNGAPSGNPIVVSLTKSSYKSSPIYATKVITAGAKKVGYLAYARFSTLSNSQPGFTEAFNTFNSSGVTDLIVDLRYNGGGYVNTAQYLINQIAPASVTGKVMFSEHYNPLMQSNKATILKNQPFLDASGKVIYEGTRMVNYFEDGDYSISGNTKNFFKAGPFNANSSITNVVFIVSGNTASASELVINSLKPYMNVKLLGVKTYGKPVGFFPVTIENKYKVYYSMFQTKNSLGQGDYFDGMNPDQVERFDDPYYDFGDVQENYLKKSLALLGATPSQGNTAIMSARTQSSATIQQIFPEKPLAGGNEFKGMIETVPKRRN
jgi:carboxyl-terminal processing protease